MELGLQFARLEHDQPSKYVGNMYVMMIKCRGCGEKKGVGCLGRQTRVASISETQARELRGFVHDWIEFDQHPSYVAVLAVTELL